MTATKPVDIIAPRKKLTKAQRVYVFDSAKGICHLCKLAIDGTKEKWEAEHPHARGAGGKDDYRVMKPAHVECHKPKTADDKRIMARTTRVRANHLGINKQIGPDKPIVSPPMPTTAKAAKRAAAGHKPPVERKRKWHPEEGRLS